MTNVAENNGNVSQKRWKHRLPERLKKLIPLTFRGQAMLFLFPLIVIISAVYTIESISTERKILRTEIIKKGEVIAAITARNSELSLLSENSEQLKDSALPVMAIKDVAFVSFFNEHSALLYHEGLKQPRFEARTFTVDSGVSFSEQSDYFEFIVPVFSVKPTEGLFMLDASGGAPPTKEHLGWVRIGLSKEVMSRSEQKIILRGGILAVLFSTAGMILLYIFVAFISRPLYALINAVKELREGEHTEVRVVSPKSEIGRLSAEFNRMSRAILEREEALQENVMELEQSQEQLQSQTLILEEKVEELQRAQDALQNEIIERKMNEEERIRLITAIDQSAEAIFITDARWHITYLNPAFERMNGYSKDEVMGKNTRILSSGLHAPEFFQHLRETVKRDNVWMGRISTKRKDGSIYEADTTISVVRNSKGSIINYVTIHRDVTKELKMERDLRQSQKMEAIGTLAGGIAHDFNNILTAIIGYTEMAQRKLTNNVTNNDPIVRDLERAQEASNRAKELVSRILTFSRQAEQERKPLQMTPVIEEVFKLLRATLPTSIEIHQQIDTLPNGDVVLADPTQLHQVLMNLGTNAAHAMRANGGIITVRLADVNADTALISLFPDLTAGPYMRLTVNDTGHGMDAGVRERIFEPYFTTKKVGEGTGMGLSVVQGIIKSHGGAISVYSEPGQGTTFTIFLPRVSGELLHVTPTETAVIGGSERILFVDDEEMLAELGQELLQALGYNVTAGTSSLEMLARFRAQPDAFDLVITDMTMPGLNGRELALELRAIRPDIPVIMCSGFTEFLNVGAAKETGISEFMMKPYVTRTLDMVIRKVLSP